MANDIDNKARDREAKLAKDIGNWSSGMAASRTQAMPTPAPRSKPSPSGASIDELWAQYQATAPKPRPKKEPVKTQPVASGAMPASAAPRQGGAPQPTAAAVPPPRAELAPGLPMPSSLAEAESYAAQMAGSIDPVARASDPRTKAMIDALKLHIQQRRAAGEKLSWEP